MSEDISDLDRQILAIIARDSHRPSAITRILKKRQVECDQNGVVAALNALERDGLVERYTSKAWIATSKAESYLEE
jgi:DNA-binding Lrp family transcriptional regulator